MSPRIFATAALVCATTAACSTSSTTSPEPAEVPLVSVASPYRSAAFTADISTMRRTVTISAPAGPAAVAGSVPFGSTDGTLHGSILGGDAIEVVASNYAAGIVGGTVPGKILITFDLTVVNRLRGLRLIRPTFPIPPANVTGIQAFPIEAVVLTSAGGVTATGGAISVASPRSGTAIPSNDWDGAPHSFFNDGACTAQANDCFRYEPFGVVEPLSATPPRRVGFLIDPTVGDLRVRILIAADLQPTAR